MNNESEVRVLTRGPDRGNPTSRRQVRGSEETDQAEGTEGASWKGPELPARARAEEVVDARPVRTKVKRRKAHTAGESAPSDEARFLSVAVPVVATSRARSS